MKTLSKITGTTNLSVNLTITLMLSLIIFTLTCLSIELYTNPQTLDVATFGYLN